MDAPQMHEAMKPIPGIPATLSLCPALAMAAALLLAACSAPLSVRTVKPPAPSGPRHAGLPLDEIRAANGRIAAGDESAIPTYNYWVGRLVEELEKSGADPWSGTLAVSTPGGIRSLKGRAPAGCAPLPDQVTPTDAMQFYGKYATHRTLIPGIGAPVVEVTSFEGAGHEAVRAKTPARNLTAVVRFRGSAAELEFVDPYEFVTLDFAGKRRTLAADPGAAVMLALSKTRIDKLGLARLLRPSRYSDTAHLNFAQPYDPDRIPVLLVHGLQDTPASFAPLYFHLLDDPVIRQRYQFWVFSYPSGYPYPYSAMLLRRELDAVKKERPDHRDLVIVGHSMGGVISRLMVTDAGDTIWRRSFGRPPAETPITGHSRDLLLEAAVFHHRKEIDRSIFISAPHKGSILASNWIGRIGSRLVKLPGFMADVRSAMISAATADAAGAILQRAPNSIDTLSPNNFFVREINKIPIVSGVPYHTIVGDRGKGDTPDSSDGVVPYWSSHLEGAASEKIVPSGHSAHQNPQGMEEVHRILLLHLKGL
jgi:pimeloyl-ACP methyl ester carboxylesterase